MPVATTWHKVRGGDQCLLSNSFTEVKLRRPRLVLGLVTGGCEPGSVCRCELHSVTDRPNTRYRGNKVC